jgi:hypothetical protein
MADWAQNDFVEGEVRNTLRCMESGENGGKTCLRLITRREVDGIAAGGQWLAFRDNTGSHSKRTCPGAMDQDNTDYTFKIEWELSNADNK